MNFFKRVLLFFSSPENSAKIMAHEFLRNHKILEVSSEGFVIISAGPKKKSIDWNDIIDIEINEDFVLVHESNNKAFKLLSSYSGWYVFIQMIPLGFKSFDYHFVKSLFGELTPCVTCGLISVSDSECLACGSHVWNESMLDNWGNKALYVRQGQISLFSLADEEEELEICSDAKMGFRTDPNWKPMITKFDLHRD